MGEMTCPRSHIEMALKPGCLPQAVHFRKKLYNICNIKIHSWWYELFK